MKIVLFLLVWVNAFAFFSEDKVKIAGVQYSIVHESYHEYGDKGIMMKVYKKGFTKDTLPLLSFTLENQTGDCSAKSIEDGNYEINGTKLTLYTHWDRSGRAKETPRGDRIQHYSFDKNGTLHFEDGVLYIERHAQSIDKDSGMAFLFEKPKTTEQKERLKTYVKSVEKEFKGIFVFEEEARKLHKNVANALMKKKRTRWK